MDFKKLWPTLIPVLALLVNSFSGQIEAFLANHSTVSLLAVTVVTALANVLNPRKDA